jgi:hypothetical protein
MGNEAKNEEKRLVHASSHLPEQQLDRPINPQAIAKIGPSERLSRLLSGEAHIDDAVDRAIDGVFDGSEILNHALYRMLLEGGRALERRTAALAVGLAVGCT